MNITLTPQIAGWIEEQIASGRYSDASEVVHEALQLLEGQRRYEAFHAAIMGGCEAAERGELVPLDMEVATRAADEQARQGHRMNPLVVP